MGYWQYRIILIINIPSITCMRLRQAAAKFKGTRTKLYRPGVETQI